MKKLLAIILIFTNLCSYAFDVAELEQQLRQTKIVQGQFIQQRFLKGLDKPIVSSGQFALAQGKGLLWQMEKPITNTMRVTPQQGIEYLINNQWAKKKQSTAAETQQIQLFLNLLEGNTQGLKEQFNLQLQGNAAQWQLQLTPNSFLIKNIFNKIEIQGGKTVQQIDLYETQGDNSRILLQQQRLNQSLTGLPPNAL
ncbi:outer membrane lipoprotein carrier protein LolA [Cricetibacter osteomyelitidis]|uniref:Outer membrane lipoprotein carrier protein LolA n=1 Tax=Cricetibacter osteomyelitidis TaxID=1521931 RepID=A0A4R2SYW1_9PAST|nr:outer membrane lipoprotein carrier protein LolA [Cricetibacter osteomyelitidis]TCP94900.1 outer membrane lipoprotein carrier protein LolA [Cricetibacter osteomyelitidis]